MKTMQLTSSGNEDLTCVGASCACGYLYVAVTKRLELQQSYLLLQNFSK